MINKKNLFVMACMICSLWFLPSLQAQTGSSTYKSVVIGTQEWMVKNLDVTTFRNGDPITEVTKDLDWKKAGDSKQPAWCYYNNSAGNNDVYGKMYNWWAVSDPRGLAPAGWRIPTDEDYKKLIEFYLKDKKVAYAALVNGGISGFNAMMGGWRGSMIGDFKDFFTYTAIYSASDIKGKWGSYFEFNAEFGGVDLRSGGKGMGGYVRCIKE